MPPQTQHLYERAMPEARRIQENSGSQVTELRMQGKSYREIAQVIDLKSTDNLFMETALRIAVQGYETLPGLLTTEQESEARRIARRNGAYHARETSKANGVGFFRIQDEEKQAIQRKMGGRIGGRAAARSRGQYPWDNPDEILELINYMHDPLFREGKKLRSAKIAESLNERYHRNRSRDAVSRKVWEIKGGKPLDKLVTESIDSLWGTEILMDEE